MNRLNYLINLSHIISIKKLSIFNIIRVSIQTIFQKQVQQMRSNNHRNFSSFKSKNDNERGLYKSPLYAREPSGHPIGLINIGNTCFLNAVIQFLYGITDLPSLIRLDKDPICSLFAKIFALLQKKISKLQQQSKILQALARQLYVKGIRFNRYSQEDALNILFNILNLIQAIHPKQIQEFDIEYQVACKCNQFKIKERILPYSSMRCIECRQEQKRTLSSTPRYIIYVNSLKQNIRHRITEEGMKHPLIYAYKAQIIYYGSGMFGHYVARRVDQGQQFEFNDYRVSKIQSKDSFGPFGIVLLYELAAEDSKKQNCCLLSQQSKINQIKSLKKASKVYWNQEVETLKPNKSKYGIKTNLNNEDAKKTNFRDLLKKH